MDYSKTVNLPKTDFPMKADLANREPIYQQFWEEKQIYKTIAERDTPKGTFILHDGPPYSNGDMHMGHALNRSLKDFIVRYKAMCGFRVPFIPGWDNHGLPIEQKVCEDFRKKHQSPDKLEIRMACRAYADKWVNIQREQCRRLGLTGDWDNPYLTMSRAYEATIIKVFGELAEQGYVYRGLKPIHWCINDETALAEAEIEYANHESPSIFVRFPLRQDPNGVFGDKPAGNCYTIIWTTTPWTIPANLAVAVHPEYEYALVDLDGDRYLLAAELTGKAMSAAGKENYCQVKTLKGSDLEGMVFKHPIFDRDSVLVHATYVTLEDGTGVVHTAPGHGRDDFETGQRYNLPALCPVDDRGYFTKEAGQFEGLHIMRQGNQAVIEALKESGALLADSLIAHSYPHCWRCHKPVVFRTTEQWFMELDHNDLRQKILSEINAVTCYPTEGRNRLYAMIESSPDWCLSRQRSWGVGIPVIFCKDCREPVMSKEMIDKVYEDALANGADSWYEKDVTEFLPAGFKCPKCGAGEFVKEQDVLDVWFDSGSSCRAVTEANYGSFLADVYLEGSDQHRGWFNKSIIIGTATKGASPFKDLVTHGYVLDAEGKKMSKSRGNVIAPKEAMKTLGADILRLYVSSLNYFEDVRFGEEMLKRTTDAYRRMRNTFRYFLGNLYDFDPATNSVARDDMLEMDRWILHRLQKLVGQVADGYDDYEFHRVFHSVYNFCAVDLSSLYLDVLKDRLYASAPDSVERRSAQTAMYELLSALVRMLAPILVHTSEEVWKFMPGQDRPESVHLADFPQADAAKLDEELEARWQRLLDIREEVYRVIEQARQDGTVGKPLESMVEISASGSQYDLLSQYHSQLPGLFIVSQVKLAKMDAGDMQVKVGAPDGEKCERCWLVLDTVGQTEDLPGLCDRCAGVVSKLNVEG